ncbi:unnamed protein product [Arctogadus glacialis]
MKSDPVCSQVFQKNSVGDVVKGSSEVGYLYILSTKMQFPDEVIGEEDPWWWTPKHTERARIYTDPTALNKSVVREKQRFGWNCYCRLCFGINRTFSEIHAHILEAQCQMDNVLIWGATQRAR